ncbi:(deoxy)nucleoside triphosphate pyrophosphohydrolase [Nocardioides sp. LHD-245]|uniref:(deoxy)nucleoside triphosphate pyrophosphohydrolase n=1 Tax=Nocardioides sp. LHD-245 TaxID=3051387 RepID=UPI0027E141A3|nr:(deoxy)nucleoside triphosphate pyrophosphohydrolase [Nocardioides sp. LHD-245]
MEIEVVGAVIVRDGLVLCARRRPGGETGGLWEFPGGKIEPGETPRQALEREIREELCCEVLVGDEITTTTHAYGFGIVTLTTFRCELMSGAPVLTEHAAVAWHPMASLLDLAWAPADVPAARLLVAGAADVPKV